MNNMINVTMNDILDKLFNTEVLQYLVSNS